MIKWLLIIALLLFIGYLLFSDNNGFKASVRNGIEKWPLKGACANEIASLQRKLNLC